LLSNGYLLALDVGTGKTLTSIAIMGALWRHRGVRRALIVAPSTVCSVWPKELEKFAGFPTACLNLVGGSKQKKLRDLEKFLRTADGNALSVVVLNYQSVFRDGIEEALEDYDAPLVILDECHYVKTHTAKVSKAMYRIGDRADYRLALTGTPITNTVADVYGQMRFVDKDVFGVNFYAFRNRYCVMGGYMAKQITGTKNEREMTDKLQNCSIMIKKRDCLDLPEETFETRYVQLSDAEAQVYRDLQTMSLAELEQGEVTAPLVITKMLRLQQVTGGFVRLDGEEHDTQVGHSKLDALQEILEEICVRNGRKLVVFARFTAEMDAIENLVKQMKLGYGRLSGNVKQEDRGGIIDRFQTDTACPVILCQTATANAGITLHAASEAVFFSRDFNYGYYVQALARIHRVGQRFPCTYIHLIAEGTIDEYIDEALGNKESLVADMSTNWRRFFE